MSIFNSIGASGEGMEGSASTGNIRFVVSGLKRQICWGRVSAEYLSQGVSVTFAKSFSSKPYCAVVLEVSSNNNYTNIQPYFSSITTSGGTIKGTNFSGGYVHYIAIGGYS